MKKSTLVASSESFPARTSPSYLHFEFLSLQSKWGSHRQCIGAKMGSWRCEQQGRLLGPNKISGCVERGKCKYQSMQASRLITAVWVSQTFSLDGIQVWKMMALSECRKGERSNDSLWRLTWICTIEAYWDRERLGPWEMPETTSWCREARYGRVCLQHGDRTGWRCGQSWRPAQAGPLWAQQARRCLGGMHVKSWPKKSYEAANRRMCEMLTPLLAFLRMVVLL